ncbi:Lrp/AsnC family transcriptional regulator [Mycolicibacterium sp. 141076]|uniref:Lrp/AsnC family transcriptional regulator n=1 Tax=Mycolicibacterium sp. 141076 TaxID=3090599 RepID=UPI00299CF1E6|nr:Lrp/AsnC family transcriptional regulator [Mycolicibacterium sp. 141076]MDX1881281.1 Lrp/AsnC family transcriptional regulator [Mycolicibacterium sp. 141076]
MALIAVPAVVGLTLWWEIFRGWTGTTEFRSETLANKTLFSAAARIVRDAPKDVLPELGRGRRGFRLWHEEVQMQRYEDDRVGEVKTDEIDELLLWELTTNGRRTNNELARKAGIAPSTCHARIKRLEQLGVIRSINAFVDYEALGFPVQAIVFVRLPASARDQVKSYASRVIRFPQVLNVFHMGGPDDFLIHVACTSTSQLRDFVATKLSSGPVAATTTSIMFDHYIGVQHMEYVSGYDEMRRPIR